MSNVTSEETQQLIQALERKDGTQEERSMFLRALLRVLEHQLAAAADLVGRAARAV
jgi:hypothetical protein